jgi:hypothetical protein
METKSFYEELYTVRKTEENRSFDFINDLNSQDIPKLSHTESSRETHILGETLKCCL